MKPRFNQNGFSVVELAIIITVVAVVGLVGYNLYSRGQTSPAGTGSSSTSASVSVLPAPSIASTGDLDKAQTTLDQNDPASSNSSDSSQLDSQLASF